MNIASGAVTDPAWFYSSLAQAAAAIIGLLGAILLAQLLRHADDMAKSRSDVVARFRAQRGNAVAQRKTAQAYKEFLEERVAVLQAALARGEGAIEVSKSMSWTSSGSSSQVWRETASEQVLKNTTDALTYCDPVIQTYAALSEARSPNDSQKLAVAMRQACDDWPDPPRGLVEGTADELDKIADAARLHNRRSLSFRMVLLLIVLIWLAGVGVVAPLSWLMVSGSATSQGWLLGLFTVGLIGLFAYLIDTFLAVRRANDLTLNKEETQ